MAYAWPFFALSVVLAALVQALELGGLIRRVFDEHVGAFSPFCSCTVVPVIAGLLANGVPLAPVMAFWIASPTMDPEIFALSVSILGWPLAWMRLAAALALSLGAGYVTLALTRTRWLAPVPGRCDHLTIPSLAEPATGQRPPDGLDRRRLRPAPAAHYGTRL